MPYVHFFSVLADNIESIISQGGYILLFILTIVEGIPVIGMAIPGHISIIVAGFLSRIGTLDLVPVIIIASIGAIMGDYIGFWIGRRYGLAFIDRLRPYFNILDSHIEKARSLLDRHAGKFMVIGRFNPATRALLPFLVGSSGMSSGRFWLWNAIGGISWVVSSVLLGYAFGAGYHVIAGYTGRLAIIFIITAALIVWGYRFVNAKFHLFRKYEVFTLILNLIALWAIISLVDALASQTFRLDLDVMVNGYMYDLYSSAPIFSMIAWWVTTLGGTKVMLALGILSSIFFLFKKRIRSSAIMLLSVGTAGTAIGFLKSFFNAGRPDNALELLVNDPSFPSGHAGMAAAFFVALAYLVVPRLKTKAMRALAMIGSVLAIVAIGLSRLVLNVHWASDVLAGWAIGIFFATASILIVRYVGGLLIRKHDRS